MFNILGASSKLGAYFNRLSLHLNKGNVIILMKPSSLSLTSIKLLLKVDPLQLYSAVPPTVLSNVIRDNICKNLLRNYTKQAASEK